jgi:hypothetical protein
LNVEPSVPKRKCLSYRLREVPAARPVIPSSVAPTIFLGEAHFVVARVESRAPATRRCAATAAVHVLRIAKIANDVSHPSLRDLVVRALSVVGGVIVLLYG